MNEREDFAHTPIDNGESCQQVEDGRAGGLGCFQVGDGRGETNVWFEAKTHQQVIWTAMAEQTRHISTDMGRVERQEVWLPVALLFAMSGDVVCSLPPITLSRIETKPEKRRQSVILGAGGSTRCICGGYSCRSVLQRIDPP